MRNKDKGHKKGDKWRNNFIRDNEAAKTNAVQKFTRKSNGAENNENEFPNRDENGFPIWHGPVSLREKCKEKPKANRKVNSS